MHCPGVSSPANCQLSPGLVKFAKDIKKGGVFFVVVGVGGPLDKDLIALFPIHTQVSGHYGRRAAASAKEAATNWALALKNAPLFGPNGGEADVAAEKNA